MNKVKEVVEYFGSKGKLARVLDVTPAAISKWGRYMPKGRAYEIEVITDGKFKAKDLVNPKL
jgi:DNA-binding transcriptional regulator YdaS (Cro superfamily)